MWGLLPPREVQIFLHNFHRVFAVTTRWVRRNCRALLPKLAGLATDGSLWSCRRSLFEDPEIYWTVLESMQNGIYLVDRSLSSEAAIPVPH